MRIHMTDRKEVVSPTRANGYYIQSTEAFVFQEHLFRYDVSPRRANGYTYKEQNSASGPREHLFRYDAALGSAKTFGMVTITNKSLPPATKIPLWSQGEEKDPSGGGAPCISSGSRPEGPCSFSCEAKLYRKKMWPLGYFWVHGSYQLYQVCAMQS